MPRRVLIDMTGLRYGRLVGLRFSHRGPCGHAHWQFSCDCGARLTIDGSKVRSGNTTSCGCRHREISAARLTIHGHRAGKRHGRTYRAWQAMKGACPDPAASGCEAGGTRDAAAVCPTWSASYECFLRDMGERPAGTTLARRDTALGFEPGNCLWVDTPTRALRARKGWEKRRSPAPTQHPPPSDTACERTGRGAVPPARAAPERSRDPHPEGVRRVS